jgi:hypothetical protein
LATPAVGKVNESATQGRPADGVAPSLPRLGGADPARGARRPFVTAVIALGLSGLVGLAATAYVALRTSRGLRLDREALDAVSSPTLVLSRLQEGLNWVSVGSVGLSILACVTLALVRRRFDLTLGAATLIAGANVSTEILKGDLFTRPDLSQGANSLPRTYDGHALDRARGGHRRSIGLALDCGNQRVCHRLPRRCGIGSEQVSPTL